MVSDKQLEASTTTTLETTPPDAAHWSSRSITEHQGLSPSSLAGVAALTNWFRTNGIRGNCRRIHCLWCSLVFESGVEALCEHVPDAADGAGVGVDPDGEAVTEQEHGDGYRCVDQR